MPYEIDLAEPLDADVRRIAREQVARAIGELGGNDRARGVHEARKALKRLRSLLRMFRGRLGAAYGIENTRLRDAARLLSGLRDSRVAYETAAALAAHAGKRAGVVEPLVAALEARYRSSSGDGTHGDRICAASAELERVASEIGGWPLEGLDRGAVLCGLARTYRAGRRVSRGALAAADAEALHEWRKDVQRHWHHMRILRALWPDEMSAREAAARRLADLLGRDHDLTNLARVASDGKATRGDRRKTVLAMIDDRQAALRAEARDLGRRLFAERPKALELRLDAYWRAGLRELGK